jgi:hypothetical protein
LLVAYIGAVLDKALDDAGGHLTIATSIQWRCCHHASVNNGGEFGSFAVGLSQYLFTINGKIHYIWEEKKP